MRGKGFIVVLLASALVGALWACDVEEDAAQACSPEDEGCVCALEDGTACDPEVDEGCTCALEQADPDMMEDMADPDMEEDMVEPPANTYRFLLIEDLTQGAAAPYPGVDLDAVTLSKSSGGTHYVTAVDDAALADGPNNEAPNVNAIVGPPDDNCEANKDRFVALGGQGGYIVVSFGTDDQDIYFEEGDTLTIHEIGNTSCNGQYDDDPYKATVQVSVMTEQGAFVELGEADGEAALPIPALP